MKYDMNYFLAKVIGKKIKEQALPGDCILVDCESIVGDGIEWLENGKISHVAIYEGHGNIIEARETGVRRSTIEKYERKKYQWMVRRINGITNEQRKKIVDIAVSYIGEPYDFFQFITLGIFLLLKKIFRISEYWIIGQSKKDLMICSELFAKGCLGAGIDLFPGIDIRQITPDMLYDTNKMTTVKELSYVREKH